MKSDPEKLTASGRVKVTLKGHGAAGRKILIQPAYKDSKGRLVYAKPKEYELPEKPGRIRPPGELQSAIKPAPKERLRRARRPRRPRQGLQARQGRKQFTITIEIPGKLHSLSPEVVTRLEKQKPLYNAPMTLIDVEGDFAAVVEVIGEINPGSTRPRIDRAMTSPSHSRARV